jgi:hypothetical protein
MTLAETATAVVVRVNVTMMMCVTVIGPVMETTDGETV